VPILLSSGIYANPGQTGSNVFDTLVAVAFVLCCVTCILSADVIASEKRDGTLGLLFLTSVRQFDVVLAKLVSSGAAALTAMLVLLPFLALPMLAGGVTGGETFRKALALLNTLFLALAVGIYSSACRPERFKAARQAALILLALTILPFLGQVLLQPYPVGRVFSPLGTLIEAGDSHYGMSFASWWPYWLGIIGVHAIGWMFLVRAGTRMRRMVREEHVRTIMVPSPDKVKDDIVDDGYCVASFKPEPLRVITPRIAWLVRRQRGLRAILWAGVLVGLLYYVFFRAFFSYRMGMGMGGFSPFVVWLPSILVGSFSGAFFAWAASRFFVEVRRTGELELLVTTPVGARNIARDQWNVLSEALVLPLTLSAFGVLLPSMFGTLTRLGSSGGEIVFLAYLLPPVVSAANVVVGTLALCRVGVWFGLKAPGQAAAILWTLGIVKGVPYLIGLGWTLFSGIIASRPMSEFWPLLSLFAALPSFVFYVWIIRVAKRGVVQELSGNSFSLGSLVPFWGARQEIAGASEKLENRLKTA
jgi:hypothetical protein